MPRNYKEKIIVFRTDSSQLMGSGHVMRCLTLADELRQRGADVMFVCREHPGNMISLIENKGFPVVRLHQPEAEYVTAPEDVAHAAWLGVSWHQDATDTIAAIGESKPLWLIIDHYAIDRRWEERLRPQVGQIMVIDDLADRLHDCDLLLDQNLYLNMNERYVGLIQEGCTKLLGPQFTMLRPQFSVARRGLRKRDGVVRRILIFFGGSDSTNETAKTLKAIRLLNRSDIEVDVVVGSANPHKHEIELYCSEISAVTYHCQINNMADLIAAADLYVGAAGTTTWERCCLGLPSLVITVAANQVQATRDLDQFGVLTHLGNGNTVAVEQITAAIEECISSPAQMKKQAEKGLALVDGSGAFRCAETIIHFPGGDVHGK